VNQSATEASAYDPIVPDAGVSGANAADGDQEERRQRGSVDSRAGPPDENLGRPDRSEWDVIILGGATADENAAQYATQFSGLDAVIVEKDLAGGECSYWACMPSKARGARP
jgi:hypothetical protein